ncbi:MAG TPA: HAMP domain-containing sensor histidine kinase [Candidatus Methylacidiphilales bacterium]
MASGFFHLFLEAFSFRTEKNTSFEVRKKLQVIRISVLAVLVNSVVRLAVNFWQGHWAIVPYNVLFLVGALVAFALLMYRHYRSAAATAILIAATIFVLIGWQFRTGMEESLLLAIAVIAFLYHSRILRNVLFVLLGAAYLGVRWACYAPSVPMPGVFAINMTAFLVGYWWVLNVLRQIYDAYREELDRKHASLEEANRTREKLLSVIAHDFVGPVGNLKSALDLLEDGRIAQRDFEDYCRNLREDVSHVLDSMRNTLAWAAGQFQKIEPHPQDTALRPLVQEIVFLLAGTARGKGVAISNRIPEEVFAWADPNQISTVIRNLVSNAVKFTHPGGFVTVSAAPLDDDLWEIAVDDTGIGMTPEKVAALCGGDLARPTPGTARETGIGLGFLVCREFVAKNGGTLRIDSTPGTGTRVRFTLRRALAPRMGSKPSSFAFQGANI